MEAELSVEAIGADLRGNLQEQHPGKAAAVGVGGVVVTGALHIEPQIDHLQGVLARIPGASALGRLLIDDVTDPVLASRQEDIAAQRDHPRGLRGELPLLEQLAGQAGRGIRTGFRRCSDPGRQRL